MKTRGWILVTNDDGVDSPALVPLLRELSRIGEARAVVPVEECSWTSKIMSRFRKLRVDRVDREGFDVWTVDGYPADCANLGVHSLFDEPPVLVVSGINMGSNAGLAFFLSSGTIGAAVEGVLGGIPSAAFSVQMEEADYTRWRRFRAVSPNVDGLLDRAAVVAREIVEELLRGGLPGNASMVSVNMPPNTTPRTPRRLTGMTPTGYGSYFARREGRYVYCFSGLEVRGGDAEGDLAVLERGEVAITPVGFSLDVDPTPEDRRRFERSGKGSEGGEGLEE